MKRSTKLAAGAVLGMLALLGTTASSCDTKADAPEPTSSNIVNGTNTQVIRFPDGFRNVAFTCYGTNGVYVTSRGDSSNPLTSSVFVLANDPHCAK